MDDLSIFVTFVGKLTLNFFEIIYCYGVVVMMTQQLFTL